MLEDIVACDESCCALVDFFYFVDVALSVGVPDAWSVVEEGVDEGSDAVFLGFGGAFVEVSWDEVEGGVSFASDCWYVGVEVEFVVYDDAEVFCCVGELKGGVVYVISLV